MAACIFHTNAAWGEFISKGIYPYPASEILVNIYDLWYQLLL